MISKQFNKIKMVTDTSQTIEKFNSTLCNAYESWNTSFGMRDMDQVIFVLTPTFYVSECFFLTTHAITREH